MNIDLMTTKTETVPLTAGRPDSPQMYHAQQGSTGGEQILPAAFTMTAPLNETEVMSLLMASPMYQRLEQMKSTLTSAAKKQPGQVDTGKHMYMTYRN